MKRAWLLAALLAASPAAAQPAAALGHPLPAADLSPGTISVRVIAGSPQNPVAGTDVTLIVNGTARLARTDSAGRAFFKDLPANATVQAKITDEDKKDVLSDEFPVPSEGGAKVMLTTRPMAAGAMGGAPFAGGMGAAGMPEPRKLSGQPRPENGDPAGQYTVRLTYDDLKDQAPPAGVSVLLVGYGADESVSLKIGKSDKDGRAVFDDLDRTGSTSYFAMCELPRNGATDRILAQPLVMLPQVGVRAILSSEKKDSTSAVIDDLASNGEPATPAGKVRVTLDGVPEPGAELSLVDAATHTVIAHVPQQPGPPDPQAISGGAPFEDKADLPAHTLVIDARGGAGNASDPLQHVSVRVVEADAQDTPADAPSSETDAAGNARVDGIAPGQKKAIFVINGREFVTAPFTLEKTGGAFHVTAQWETTGKPEAVFDYIPRADQVIYAETKMRGQTYRSRPFEGLPERGTHIVLQIYPRVLFAFSLTSHVEDQFLAVQGRFELFNNSWAPYSGGPDGITIPLPKGFKGGILAEQDQGDVSVDPSVGFKIVRPVPPGGRRFVGGFSLPVSGGVADWDLDLPFGAYQSGIEIRHEVGMSLRLPAGISSKSETDTRGDWDVLPQITIMPNQSMVMSIGGLPAAPTWSVWVPRILGLTVVAVMLGGVGIALARRRGMGDAARAERRQKLLDELVELERGERDAKQDKRREAVLAELEELWEQGAA